MSPEAARNRAQRIRQDGDWAYTLSFVSTVVNAGPPPTLQNLVQIVTIIGASAEARVVHFEAAHRIINETLATGGSITTLLNTLTGTTSSLSETELNLAMIDKLRDLDNELGNAWEHVMMFDKDRKDIDKVKQEEYGQMLAALLRDVFNAVLQVRLAQWVAVNGSLDMTSVFLVLAQADADVTYLSSLLADLGELDDFSKMARKDFQRFIRKLLGAQRHGH